MRLLTVAGQPRGGLSGAGGAAATSPALGTVPAAHASAALLRPRPWVRTPSRGTPCSGAPRVQSRGDAWLLREREPACGRRAHPTHGPHPTQHTARQTHNKHTTLPALPHTHTQHTTDTQQTPHTTPHTGTPHPTNTTQQPPPPPPHIPHRRVHSQTLLSGPEGAALRPGSGAGSTGWPCPQGLARLPSLCSAAL